MLFGVSGWIIFKEDLTVLPGGKNLLSNN